ncbi:sugar-phosphatase [Rouxiella chamberiensis]|uniref:Sugar-phosphatase n=1 Tax=Rouxiella chamberiensis TaxID=1513468 RepID=A0ABY7HNL4_9GAMM|nr:sugar-phosphatase [Rouxiella chamberiensis]WAT00627.1 sugar-phosphatase [Rouxiella chamberiensis]
MAIELIAIDMDGTLLNPQHEVTPAVKNALAAAVKQGVQVVLATGRPFIGIKRYLQELDLEQAGCYCISNNGALVHNAEDGSIFAETTLAFNDFLYFESLARLLGVSFQALTYTDLYTANQDISPYTIHEAYITGIPLHYRSVEQMDREMRFPKVMMIDHPEKLDHAITQIPHDAKERYTIMKSSPYYLEILHKSVNKGQGVKKLAEKLGIARESIMTLGDQENDIAMLEYAGLGVAMGNALDSVKAVSQFVTKTNSEDGVAFAIDKFVLNK